MKFAHILILITSLFATAALAGGEDRRGPITFKSPDGGQINGLRCGAPNHHPTQEGLRDMRRAARSGVGPNAAAPVTVSIAYHVINSSSLPDLVSDQVLWD
jgi:hypothetical protein